MNLYIPYYSHDILTRVNLDTLTREADLDLTPGGGGDVAEDSGASLMATKYEFINASD